MTPEGEAQLEEITEARLKAAMRRAVRVVGAITLIAGVVLWAFAGWQTALLLVVGALISVASLWEWQKLMALILERLDNQRSTGGARVILGFLLRLLVAGVVLYGSLKSLHGSVFALLGGLALAVIALAIEAARLVRS